MHNVLNRSLVMGMQIMVEPNMTVTKSRDKTFRERWLSWPWKPWRRLVVWQEPSEECYVLNNRTIVCHPEMAYKLRRELADG